MNTLQCCAFALLLAVPTGISATAIAPKLRLLRAASFPACGVRRSAGRTSGTSPLANPPAQAWAGIASGFVPLCLVSLSFLVLIFASPAVAEKGKLLERLTPDVMAVVYPGAERLGPEEGSPPAIAVYRGDTIVAYIFSTLDIIAAPGYSVIPFDVIAGVEPSGRITGAKVVFHREPYVYQDAVRQPQLDRFLEAEAGVPLNGSPSQLPPNFVAQATITARLMRAAVHDTARMVLHTRLGRQVVTMPTLDVERFELKSWNQLIAEGSVARLRVTSGEVAAALAKLGAADGTPEVPLGKPDELYSEVFFGLLTPAAIGGNLLGVRSFEEYRQRIPQGRHVLFFASNGPYDFHGTHDWWKEYNYRFDRIRIVQDGHAIGFVHEDYQKLLTGAAEGLQSQQEAGLFTLPANAPFDPVKPWRLELLVNAAEPAVTVAFPLEYKLSAAHILMPDEPAVAAWVEAWRDARLNVAILAALLTALTAIFVFQGQLSRSRLGHRLVRVGFLSVVLVWLGWIAGAQLSIVNVINYVQAPFRGFDVGFYLTEPLMVMIAAYTLVSVVLIGRGVFCGWLCPFGALQELLAQASRALSVPQWNPSTALQKRLWMGKYIAAAAVLLLVLSGVDGSGVSAEIEPFKTAITSKFTRAWPYVLYAGVLLGIGLFSERAYCRFLCPLGGVLAALDRLHLIDLLKRRPECGNPCHLCERSCPVRAIEPSGKIIMAECFQCLDCQVEYYDDKRCPPLVQSARRREEATSIAPVAAMAKNPKGDVRRGRDRKEACPGIHARG
jgi:NosR/NirI family transcriptional regulator, nitrous oxide reductase regulator